ncbi:MAG TPA: PIN domain-containing protein [Beijerinckiaceae bacterium]
MPCGAEPARAGQQRLPWRERSLTPAPLPLGRGVPLARAFRIISADLRRRRPRHHDRARAADLCLRHKLATADAIVYATARADAADLLTCDHFEGLPAVRFVTKGAGWGG